MQFQNKQTTAERCFPNEEISTPPAIIKIVCKSVLSSVLLFFHRHVKQVKMCFLTSEESALCAVFNWHYKRHVVCLVGRCCGQRCYRQCTAAYGCRYVYIRTVKIILERIPVIIARQRRKPSVCIAAGIVCALPAVVVCTQHYIFLITCFAALLAVGDDNKPVIPVVGLVRMVGKIVMEGAVAAF